MKIPVFVSCPTALAADQDRVRRWIVLELERLQLEPRALGRSDYPAEFPLREVHVIAKHCSGGMILGFRQCTAIKGVWRKGTKKEERISTAAHFPSPWNQLEAGILFGLNLPLLIFREEPMRGGVFDDGVTDVFVHSMPKTGMRGRQLEAFREVLLKWSSRIRDHYYRTN